MYIEIFQISERQEGTSSKRIFIYLMSQSCGKQIMTKV